MRVFVGLGANLGDTLATFSAAAGELRRLGQLSRASSLYRSAPRDVVDQPEFTNAVVELETELSFAELLLTLKRIEQTLGRDAQAARYGPRMLDLDILAADGHCFEDTSLDLIVPHPRLHERRFALEPIAELDPSFQPWRGCADVRRDVTVTDLLASVGDQEVQRFAGPEWADLS